MIPEQPASPPPVLPTEPIQEARPWGLWATVGWSLLIMLLALVAQTAAIFVVALVQTASGVKIDPERIANDGDYLAVATCGLGVAGIGLSIFFAAVRKGITVKDYLALRLPRAKEFVRHLLVLFGLVLLSDGISLLLGKPIVPEVMIEIYQSASWALPILWVALLITAPLSEEFFFRGFMFAGLQRSALGTIGTIVLTAAVWAAIHVQYDLHGILVIFFLGLFLGWVRYRTGSLWLCVMLHSIMNLIATIQLLIVLARR
jgi:membrane protease YdiL (CAAX protease family)